MNPVSKRAAALAPSETLKITALAKDLQRAGRSVISLSAGEPDFKTPGHICEAAIRAIRDGHHGYTVNAGTMELRQAICAKLKRDNGLTYTPDEIIVSNGAKQSVGFAILATVDPGDEVIIPAPYWVSYPEMVRLAEGVPVPVRTPVSRGYKLTPEQLEAAITPRTRMLILCSPSNPTGACYTEAELKALAAVLLRHPDILVLSDEIYEYIVFEGAHVGIAQAEPRLKDRVLLVNGFSKGFAMTGWRLGYLAAAKPIVDAVGKLQSQETSAPSTISQKAGEAALGGPMDAVLAMREAFRERRDFLVAALNAVPGVTCPTPGGAFYVFPDISAHLGKRTPAGQVLETSTDLVFHLIEAAGIAAVPGDAFGEPTGIRFSYAMGLDDLKEAARRFAEGMAALR